ncbi:serine/threonine-protein kinase [Arthrobacter sp. NPDC092385]|uniref:serine/threonine-protein kinase n=1 Tax=Arthrobacter sp. NPDC092385 TaxID=3363943 RepID=UPI003814ED9D
MRVEFARPAPDHGVAEAGDMEKQALAGRYALGERVGTGGMAEVFTARDTRLERDVAVKLFRSGMADGPERGSAEARLLAGLDHPGLVRVLDMDNGEHSGENPYLVMELVRGPDLGVLLRTAGPLGREEVRLMALDLARTLQYIHERGIVHRDIKPSNILTREADPHSGFFRYLLTDFGIARFFDGGRMTATGQVIGSAAYFSPEQARGDAVGQPSDIYSLGLVLIEALTGERAFPGTGVESALARLSRSPSVPHAAGPALSALLVAMTLDGPDDRPDAARVVRELIAMGVQGHGEVPATTALPVHAPPTAALSVPDRDRAADEGTQAHDSESVRSGFTQAHDSGTHDGAGADTSRLTQAHDGAGADTSRLTQAHDGAGADTSPLTQSVAATRVVAGPARGSDQHPSSVAEESGATSVTSVTAVGPGPAAAASLPVSSSPASRVSTTRDSDGSDPATVALPEHGERSPSAAPSLPGQGVQHVLGTTGEERPSSRPPRGRRGRGVPWLVALLVVAVLAAGLWAFTTLFSGDPAPGIEPLPAVPGEPGEKLQELYESVQE